MPLRAPHERGALRMLNTGDTAWMIVATALVLLMTLPGLALFYGGLVRS
ncbi:MAG: ammonium transporter, partial [Gammaproteobacteria bacterium]|nr:ammonium transporter [Gammaproteobacteria bacterium]